MAAEASSGTEKVSSGPSESESSHYASSGSGSSLAVESSGGSSSEGECDLVWMTIDQNPPDSVFIELFNPGPDLITVEDVVVTNPGGMVLGTDYFITPEMPFDMPSHSGITLIYSVADFDTHPFTGTTIAIIWTCNSGHSGSIEITFL